MKVFIAYDGSEAADTAIDGLRRAGLPADGVKALVMSVGEVWSPPAVDVGETFPPQPPPGLTEARQHAERIMQEAQAAAERGSKRVQQIFPQWRVSHEAHNGSPAFELLNQAEAWQPDLIFVGSQEDSAEQVCARQCVTENFDGSIDVGPCWAIRRRDWCFRRAHRYRS